MKKEIKFLVGIFVLLLSLNAKAQSKTGTDYFAGKWNVLIKGTPNGDVKMFVVLKTGDTAMTGVVQDSTGNEMSRIDKIDLNGDTITIYFSAQGYDVNITMNKKDDDHIAGSLMSMFAVDGDRVKVLK
jgi:hypothetical protein